jgi:hypothetical protein
MDLWSRHMKKWGTGGSLILTFWCFLTHLCITHRVHTSIYKSKHGVCVFVCMSLMNERTNERMTFFYDGGEGGSYSLSVFFSFLISVCRFVRSLVLPSIRPSLQSRPVPCGASKGGQHGGGTSEEGPGEGETGREGPDGGGARHVHYARGSH